MFYLIEVNKERDGKNSQAVYAYDTIEAAVIAFHQSVAYAMSDENVIYMGRTILDEGMRHVIPQRLEIYERPIPEEPTPEE